MIDSAEPFMEGGARHEELSAGARRHNRRAARGIRRENTTPSTQSAHAHARTGTVRTSKRRNPAPPRSLPSDPDELAGEIIDELDRLVPLEDAGAGGPVLDRPAPSDEADLVPPELETDASLIQVYEEDLARTHDPAGAEMQPQRAETGDQAIRRSATPPASHPGAGTTPSAVETTSTALTAKDVEARHSQFLADALENQRAARRQGIHPYQTEDATSLIDRARDLLRLEALPAANARALRDAVAAYDDWFRSRRRAPQPATAAVRPRRGARKSRAQTEFDALYDKFLTEAAANRAAARNQGIHPYMTENAAGIIRQARELIRLDRLPGGAAETLADTIVQYERMCAREAQRQTAQETRTAQRRRQEDRKGKDTSHPTPAPAPRPAQTPSPQTVSPVDIPTPPVAKAESRTEPARPRTNSPSATETEASPPLGAALEEYRAWIERKRVEMEELFVRRSESAKPEPAVADPAPVDPAPQPLSADELFDELKRHCDANVETARATDVEPYETEAWSSIHEAARHLVARDDVPDDARPYIRDLIAGYYRWEARQQPRHDPPTQSHGIRY